MVLETKNIPVVLIVGKSGSGKTRLLQKLITVLAQRGLRAGTIKHAGHGFEMDMPGKDSRRHRQAGAVTTIISSPSGIGMLRDVNHDHKPIELLEFFPDVDIVIAEGYKRESLPKIEVFRPEVHKTPVCKGDKNLLALVSEAGIDLNVPRFSPDDINKITDFLINRFKLSPNISRCL